MLKFLLLFYIDSTLSITRPHLCIFVLCWIWHIKRSSRMLVAHQPSLAPALQLHHLVGWRRFTLITYFTNVNQTQHMLFAALDMFPCHNDYLFQDILVTAEDCEEDSKVWLRTDADTLLSTRWKLVRLRRENRFFFLSN